MSNDIIIIGVILFIFLGLGATLPYVDAEFNQASSSGMDIVAIGDGIGDQVEITTAISAWDILLSVIAIPFFTIANIPWFMVAFMVLLRIIFWITIARNVWVGGGA